MVWNWSKNLWI